MDSTELFYVPPQQVQPEVLTVQGDEFHHLSHVLRKRTGDGFSATDGRGNVFDCLIDQIQKDSLTARIIKKKRFVGEPVLKLTLALALLKKGRFEWVVEKATEVGVSAFIPLQTERTVLRGSAANTRRCERIALAAMKQSNRSLLPSIASVQTFETVCRQSGGYSLKLLAHEKTSDVDLDRVMAHQDRQYAKSAILCIGPEGGFTEDEVTFAKESGFAVFGLGPRRMRSETAAIVAAALILNRMGELK